MPPAQRATSQARKSHNEVGYRGAQGGKGAEHGRDYDSAGHNDHKKTQDSEEGNNYDDGLLGTVFILYPSVLLSRRVT